MDHRLCTINKKTLEEMAWKKLTRNNVGRTLRKCKDLGDEHKGRNESDELELHGGLSREWIF